MKILMLTKFSETDDYVRQFAERIHDKEPLEIDLLHVINSYPEVPLKDDGSITDFCTEVDLTELLAQQSKAVLVINEIDSQVVSSREVLIGHLDKIVTHKVRSNNYDALFMGAHSTKLFQDLFTNTTLERMINCLDIPILSLKCNRSEDEPISRIGVFDDFSGEHRNIKEVKKIADAFDAEVHLYKIKHKSSETQADIEQNMADFADYNGLENFRCHVLGEQLNDEDQMTVHMIEDHLHMIVVPELHRQSLNWLYPKDLKASVANHVFAPLFIY